MIALEKILSGTMMLEKLPDQNSVTHWQITATYLYNFVVKEWMSVNCARQIDGERDLFFLQKQRQFIV